MVNMMGDPGLSPMGLGVVAGSSGGDAMVGKLLKSASGSTPVEAAKAYMALKYPRLMNMVDLFDRNMGANTAGASNPYNKVISLLTGKSGAITLNKAVTDPGLTVDTLGHELTHSAIQATRTPEMLGSNYVESAGVPTMSNPKFAAYYNQPAEVNARRGGATALNTLQNFVDKYPELRKLFTPQ